MLPPPHPLADGKASLDPLRSVQFSAHGLAAHVAPVRRHCYAANRAGQQPARRCDARSNVVLLPMAEQKESCIRLMQATFLQVYQSLYHYMVIFPRIIH